MDITWYGHSCFRITDRGQITIVTDPFAEDIGLPPLKVKGDVVTVSHNVPGHNFVEGVRGYQHVVYRAGEYEIGNVFITGIALDYVSDDAVRPNVGFLLDYGSLNVLHLGDLSHVPDQSSIERMGQVNVLLVPVGGGNGLKAAEAAEVVALFEPNFVVPMHYGLPGLRFQLEGVEKFLKAMGVTKAHEAETLRVSPSDLPEQTQVVVLTPMAPSRNTENGG